VKALTVRQPWATLIVRGIKRVETRSWHYSWADQWPMPLAIHAAKGFSRDEREFAEYLVRSGVLGTVDLPRGAIVGTVQFDGWCWSSPPRIAELAPSALELELGDWSPGRILWQLSEPVEFDTPIPRRGELGIFNWLSPDFVGLDRAIAEGMSR
jgi:hypothetical protein